MGQAAFDSYLKSWLVINVPNPAETYPDINTVWAETQKRFGTIVEITNYEPVFRYSTINVQYIT